MSTILSLKNHREINGGGRRRGSVERSIRVDRMWHDSADVAKKVNVALLEWGRRYLEEVWITCGARGWLFAVDENL